MKLTLSVIKADIGSIGGHIAVPTATFLSRRDVPHVAQSTVLVIFLVLIVSN